MSCSFYYSAINYEWFWDCNLSFFPKRNPKSKADIQNFTEVRSECVSPALAPSSGLEVAKVTDLYHITIPKIRQLKFLCAQLRLPLIAVIKNLLDIKEYFDQMELIFRLLLGQQF